MTDVSRRKFIQLTVIGAAAAAAGCGPYRDVDDEIRGQYGGTSRKIEPLLDQPAGLEDGVAKWFSTTCRMCPAGCGLIVRSFGGRAIKVEGNPLHPVNLGATCARGQASLQHLYNPGRVRYPSMKAADGVARRVDWSEALDALSTRIASGKAAVLADADFYLDSPATSALLSRLTRHVYYYSLIDDAPWRAAAGRIYGREAIPRYSIGEAEYLLAFSGNFLEAWPSPVMHGKMFGEFRQGSRGRGRYVYIGPRLSMTAAKADTWLPCRPGTEAAVALGILRQLGGSGLTLSEAAGISGLSQDQIAQVAREFKAAGARALAMAGDGLIAQPTATSAIAAVESLNAHIGSELVHAGDPARGRVSHLSQAISLGDAIHAGRVDSVIVLGPVDPMRTLPASTGLPEALGKVFLATITTIEDTTSRVADLVLPAASFLEEWADVSPSVQPAGSTIVGLCQPVVDTQYIPATQGSADPWMTPRPVNDILNDLMNRGEKAVVASGGQEALRSTLPSRVNLAEVMAGSGCYQSPSVATSKAIVPNLVYAGPRGPQAEGTFSLIMYPDIYQGDGRHGQLPWLREIPSPMSMAVWNNWLEINAGVAHDLGIRTGDIVRIETSSGAVELPALPTQGIHPEAVACPLMSVDRKADPLPIVPLRTDPSTGALAYGLTTVRMTKVRDAEPGYSDAANTLVVLEDRPGGAEPAAVKDLIHTTAREFRKKSGGS